jgi:hypothetical protein
MPLASAMERGGEATAPSKNFTFMLHFISGLVVWTRT